MTHNAHEYKLNERSHPDPNPRSDGTAVIPRLSCWEFAALERISEHYWDERVLACESWDEARDEIAIDGLLSSLVEKLRHAAEPLTSGDGDAYPLEDEGQLRAGWIESGGKP